MATIHTSDIATISSLLVGKVTVNSIQFSQILPVEHGASVNDLLFVGYKFGLYFYTSRADFDRICYLQKGKFPTLVVCKDSKNVYEIK